ncbi:MAG: phage holin family protein, partial [Candidatus Nealsonbacteria bacterium]|nr:phage holin family protein [Candidatus Nealsonbacteria bacterium]
FWQSLLLAGLVLGLINFFIKPILKLITLPLRILTLGLFGLIINMAIIWMIDVLFPELIIQGIIPLFWTTLIVWTINFLLGNNVPRKWSQN